MLERRVVGKILNLHNMGNLGMPDLDGDRR